MTDTIRAVLYTDGGCKPSRGIGGWGVHGYLFDEHIPKVGTGQKDWFITPTGYVDAAIKLKNVEWLNKWGELTELATDPKVKNVNVIKYIDAHGSLIPESTNNIAEITAMTNAVELLVKHNLALMTDAKPVIKQARIITDSRYTKDGIENWVHGWIENGWVRKDGQPVANVALWKNLHAIKTTLEGQGTDLKIEWVKGHAGEQEGVERDNLGNELADHYASISIIAGKKGELVNKFKTSDPKGYWKPKVEVNRLFAHSRWYFNTNKDGSYKTPDGKTVYHLGDHGKDDDFLGKRMSDASFAILHLKDPDPALENIREYQREEDVNNLNSFVISRLDFVFKPAIYPSLVDDGCVFLERKSHKLDLYTATNFQLTKELRPPRLAFNLVEIMSVLEDLLAKSLSGEKLVGIAKTDITHSIYEFEEKKGKSVCKIKPELTSAVKSLTASIANPINTTSTNIPLTIGMDLPHRNALSALADKHPKVHVIAWKESNRAFRYATTIEVGEDAGIFAGFYSNLHLLTT